jgi:hypothetical protein
MFMLGGEWFQVQGSKFKVGWARRIVIPELEELVGRASLTRRVGMERRRVSQ